jgi:hypothetical protein
MKPRGNPAVEPPKAVIGADVSSATEGQTTSLIAPILGRAKAEQKGEGLEPENAEKPQLENALGVAAQAGEDDQLTALAEALVKSFAEDLEEGEDDPEVPDLGLVPTDPEEGDAVTVQDGVVKIFRTGDARLGPQKNGDYGIAINIREGYWEAVKQWAEADGVAPEEWCNMRFTEYMETWSSPAKGR